MRRTARALLAIVLGLACAACGGAPRGDAPAPASSAVNDSASATTAPAHVAPEPAARPIGLRRGLTVVERGAIDALLRTAERVRGLSFVRPVDVEVHDEHRIAEQLREELAEENLVESREIYVALGLLDEDVDLEALITAVLTEQVVGYYDPEDQRLVVRDDVMRGLGRIGNGLDEARIVLVHELVHALQDQQLELGARIEDERDSDPDTAYRSVVEGDATLAMIGYAAALANQSLSDITRNRVALESLAAAQSDARGELLERAPAILRVSLVAPYLRGLTFVAALHGAGGWDAVNSAHRRLPASTEQVIHPEKYASRELPDAVALPAFRALDRAGYATLPEDTLGELELSVYLGQRAPRGVDERAASGWSGDRLRVYRHDAARPAVVWWTVWDDEAEAREAEAAARRVSPTGTEHRVERVGRAVQILRWLPPALQAEPLAAFRAFAAGLPPSPPQGEASPGPIAPP